MSDFIESARKPVKYWYLPLIAGIILIVLGIYIFTVPMETYLTLTIFFSLSFIFSGILEIIFSIQNRHDMDGWGWYLAGGIFSLIIGIILLMNPQISAVTLPLFVGFSLLFRSFQALGLAFDLKKAGILNWGNLALISVLGIIASVLLLLNPIMAGFSLVMLTAIAFILAGIASISLSMMLRRIKKFPERVHRKVQEQFEKKI